MSKHTLFAVSVIAVVLSSAALAADTSLAASFAVQYDPTAPVLPALGANISALTGGTNFASNNLIRGGGFEPAYARYLVRVERAGSGWFEWDESLGGVHMWEQNADGFADGAEIKFYRLVDGSGKSLSYAGKTNLAEAADAREARYLGTASVPSGGWKAGGPGKTNRVNLSDRNLALAYGDHAIIAVKKFNLPKTEVNPRLYQYFIDRNNSLFMPEGAGAVLRPHGADDKVPGATGGTGSFGESALEITYPKGVQGWAGQYLFHRYDDGEGQWYGQLIPGASYRVSAWLKSADGAAHRVRFASTGPYSALRQPVPWTVGGEWKEYVWDFQGPPYPAEPWHGGLGFEIEGPAKILVDNFAVWQNDAAHGFAPFGPNRLSLDELMAAMPPSGPKPALRFYPVQYSGQPSLQGFLGDYGSSSVDFIYNIQSPLASLTVSQCLRWALATGESPETRAVPWLTVPEEYTETEWIALGEYLGVPYDSARDAPETKPWAYLRFLQRGHGRPWTDDFREIMLEFGNETWHQGAGGYGWDGFGRPGWVHTGGREYGLFARLFIREGLARQPWWGSLALERKIKFVLNANYEGRAEGYGAQAAAAFGPGLKFYLGHATYVGPKWETGETPHREFSAHGLQESLVAGLTGVKPMIDAARDSRDSLRALGLADYDLVAYEGGPSGYYVPGTGTDEQARVSQLYGKSQALAAGTLDTWLMAAQAGFASQQYFAFASGENWTSHTMPLMGGFRRHAGWLALMLHNRVLAGGRFMRVEPKTLPSYDREGEELPLVGVYALDFPDRISLVVINRAVPGSHSGDRFGTGVIPAKIRLPPGRYGTVRLDAVFRADGGFPESGDSNLTHPLLSLESKTVGGIASPGGQGSGPVLTINAQTGALQGGTPPGSVLVYTVEKK